MVPTHVSCRDNEKAHGVMPDPGWAAIADGMGGHQAGECASQLAVDAIKDGISELETDYAALQLMHTANRRLFDAMRAGIGKPAMGTTLVGISIRADRALIFNVGDSRAYILSGGYLRQVSKDDVVQHGNGARRSHALTQALGGLRTEVTISPHVSSFKLRDDDTILLCSDGLTDMIVDNQISSILISDSDDPATTLIDTALRAGGHDNVTVVVISGKRTS